MRRARRLAAFVFFSVLLFSPHATSQTTSSIVGRVADEAGAPLPGAGVETSSAALQGTRMAVTDTQGRYRLPLLPPGAYTVTFTLAGFAKEQQTNVVVSLGRDTFLNADLHLTTKVATSARYWSFYLILNYLLPKILQQNAPPRCLLTTPRSSGPGAGRAPASAGQAADRCSARAHAPRR